MHLAYLLTPPGIPLGGPSGSSRHVASLVQAFLQQGARVTLIAARALAPLPPHPGLTVLVPPPRTPPFWIRGLPARERFAALTLARQAVEALAQHPPDLIYERYALFSPAGALLRKRFQVPWWLEVNAPLRLERARFEGLKADGVARRAERAILTSADGVLAVSAPMRSYLLETVGVLPERAWVEWNGYSPQVAPATGLPAAPGDPGALRAESETDGPVVGYLGSFKPWHGLDAWLEAFSACAARLPRLRGLLIGDGPGRAALEQGLTARGLAPRVTFLGQCPPDQVPAVLRQVSVLLAPWPRLEPFYFCPLKVMEGLAAGIPVVTTAQGELPRLVGEAGWLVPPDDSLALEAALMQALTDPLERTRRAALAPAQVMGFTWTEVAGRILARAGDVSR